jgi:hypothetical protein
VFPSPITTKSSRFAAARIFTSFVLELVVYPVIYEIRNWHCGLKRELAMSRR